jgi:predicted AAA+ superfamily ATPase
MGAQMLIDRPIYLEKIKGFMHSDLIKIITGVRRCGKSTLFVLFQNYLTKDRQVAPEQIIEINLESADFRDITTWGQLHDHISARLQKDRQNYVFIDEIQTIPAFERAVNSLNLNKNVDMYITGSNANMLSSEIATLFSGRYIEIPMLPLSFKEYMSAQADKTNLPKHFNEYIATSTLPGATQLGGDRAKIDEYVKGVYNTIVLKDIVARYKIPNVARLESVIDYMFDNIGNKLSIKGIYDTLKSDGRKVETPTIENYLSALLESFILYKAQRFDIKGKKLMTTNDKYYLVDMGFRNMRLGHRNSDWGHILENVVYLELLRRGYEVYVGKIDLPKKAKKNNSGEDMTPESEVDFFARKNGITEYYQVSQTIIDKATLKREITPLEEIDDFNQRFILSMDYMDLDNKGIKQVNVLEWLLAE